MALRKAASCSTRKVWQILLHVVNHSTHHRSELIRYLEDYGHPIDEQYTDFGSFIARRDA
jgi:uncharacterized damage-inducible protein DinB